MRGDVTLYVPGGWVRRGGGAWTYSVNDGDSSSHHQRNYGLDGVCCDHLHAMLGQCHPLKAADRRPFPTLCC
jgi:hypothetical protein